ncbi:MAG: CoA transferase, partial [Clostridiales bacterium]|nr:CoA transferase [Clostridiales bacterium]
MGDPLRYTAANEGRPLDQKENTSYDLENAGKRCIALNIKSPEGREVLEKLIADADVFITNNRQPSLIKNKLDYDTLHAKYPALVYGFISGYGEKGPDKDLPGFDFTAFYARGGILGPLRDKTSTPMLTVQGFGDHQVAMNLAAGILASLFKAKMTGEGDQVVVSLFHSAVWDVSLMLQSSQYGADSCKFPMERWENGNPLTMVYKTKDEQWLQIAMPQYDRHYPVFMQAAGHPEMIDNPKFYPQKNLYPNRKEFSEWISALFLTKDCAEWCKLLDAADIPYAVAQNWDTLLVDEQAWASDIFYEMQYSNGNKRTLVRPPVMFKENGLPEYNRGPYLAEHTEEILGQYGYTDEEISKMLADGAVKSMDPALRD